LWQVELGSESVSAEIELDVFRSARLNAEPTLQGFQRGDRNAQIRMNVSIGPDEKFTDLYWIIHRQHIIYEGWKDFNSLLKTSKYHMSK
jgi:hypothetical protein